ncbi:hypothetical protein [Sedimenticola hydrogenitrophicus]|uniref:hypothetical protein n=1 Tax=Sedimenticola hydrogenitrophicus TaxID=2967975 RepID=UPI002FFD073F
MVGEITALAGTAAVAVFSGELWLLGEEGNGEFPGLPYFLHDQRPQGFLGWRIANSDMHLGNLTLAPGQNRFRLHPVYDMVPMRWL